MGTSPDTTRRSGGHARPGPLLRTRDADAAPPRHRAPVAASKEGTRARPGRVNPKLLAAGAAGAAVLVAGGAALALGGDDAPPAPSSAAPRATAGAAPSASATAALPTPTAALPTPTGALPPAPETPSPAVVAATAADRTPADARAALEEQLSSRAAANLALLRSTWAGDAEAAARAAQAVAASGSGMSAVVTAWRDAALAGELRAALDQQTEASRAYAAAVAGGDVAAADRARAAMGQISRDLGGALAAVTDDRIASYVPPQDAARYRAFVDALEAGDDAAAQDAASWLQARLAREGAALALALTGGGPA